MNEQGIAFPFAKCCDGRFVVKIILSEEEKKVNKKVVIIINLHSRVDP